MKIKIGNIAAAVIQRVGNKTAGDGIAFSSELSSMSNVEEHIHKLIDKSFKYDDLRCFTAIDSLEFNPVYRFASRIFDDNSCVIEQANNLARHLYEQSVHPNIKIGEFSVILFHNNQFDEDTVEAIGLFKSENKETVLKVLIEANALRMTPEQGISLRKLDKGCIIFNKNKESGYKVAVVDNTNSGNDTQYWIDDFLNIRQCQDNYHDTQNMINLAKNFIKELPSELDMSRVDKINLVNKTAKFFKEKDSFEMEEFANEVIEKPKVIESFNRYKDNYAQEQDVEFAESFTISNSAVKKGTRSLKSVIKLDKNFHIYIHGDRQLIEQGEDNKGKFYKVYYKEEQ